MPNAREQVVMVELDRGVVVPPQRFINVCATISCQCLQLNGNVELKKLLQSYSPALC